MVDAVTTNTAVQTGATTAGRSALVSNFETFLSLLTAQLKNQDPLSPMDSTDFTAQLTQMAGVEQQLLTNDLLQALVNQSAGGLDGAVQYIGKEVVAAGSAVKLDGGDATWSYELATNAANVQLQVKDATGAVVWSGPAPTGTEGIHDFTWDGIGNDGVQRADGGVYSLSVASATNASGQTVQSQVLIRGVVTGVEMYDGQPYLTVGGSILPLSQVISVSQATQASTTTGDQEESQGILSSMASTAKDLLDPRDEIMALAGALNPLRLL